MHDTGREALEDALGARVTDTTSIGGGSIHDARKVALDDGRTVFVKLAGSLTGPSHDVFEREAEGLVALADAADAIDDLRVPRPLAVGREPPFLVLELIDEGRRDAGFMERFGRALAQLHRHAVEPDGRFGFAHDNNLGATPQPNGWLDDWPTFWRRRRLGPLLEAARRGGVSDPELDRLGDRLLERLDDLLAVDEPPSLLHGDLWGGNYLVGAGGEAVLIDPAASYGHREADLAMTRLFGGFDTRFEAAYAEVWPLADGAAERAPIYELHHLLNHLVLFGRGYRGGCIERLRRAV